MVDTYGGGLAKSKPEEECSIGELYRPHKSKTAGRDFILFLIKVDFFFFFLSGIPSGMTSGRMMSADHHPRAKSSSF